MSGTAQNDYAPMHQRSFTIATAFQASADQQFVEQNVSEMNQSVLGSIRNSFQILGTKMKNKIKDALDFYGRPVVDYA